MKFLIINKQNGDQTPFEDDYESVTKAIGDVRAVLDNGTVEAAYVLHSGGHVYIVDADNSEELALKIRYNPLFRCSETEVIPIEDAITYLEGYAAHLKTASVIK